MKPEEQEHWPTGARVVVGCALILLGFVWWHQIFVQRPQLEQAYYGAGKLEAYKEAIKDGHPAVAEWGRKSYEAARMDSFTQADGE